MRMNTERFRCLAALRVEHTSLDGGTLSVATAAPTPRPPAVLVSPAWEFSVPTGGVLVASSRWSLLS